MLAHDWWKWSDLSTLRTDQQFRLFCAIDRFEDFLSCCFAAGGHYRDRQPLKRYHYSHTAITSYQIIFSFSAVSEFKTIHHHDLLFPSYNHSPNHDMSIWVIFPRTGKMSKHFEQIEALLWPVWFFHVFFLFWSFFYFWKFYFFWPKI